MKINKEIQEIINSSYISCSNVWCQKECRESLRRLMDLLCSPKIISMEYKGEYKFNPQKLWSRSVYEISHIDGRKLKLAFTGMGTIQIFSKRNRQTHCRTKEFKERLNKFENI